MQVRDLADFVACELNAENLVLFDGAMNESKKMFTKQVDCPIRLAIHRGWAKLLLGRCRDRVQDPRQPRTHKREADEDGAEAQVAVGLRNRIGLVFYMGLAALSIQEQTRYILSGYS